MIENTATSITFCCMYGLDQQIKWAEYSMCELHEWCEGALSKSENREMRG